MKIRSVRRQGCKSILIQAWVQLRSQLIDPPAEFRMKFEDWMKIPDKDVVVRDGGDAAQVRVYCYDCEHWITCTGTEAISARKLSTTDSEMRCTQSAWMQKFCGTTDADGDADGGEREDEMEDVGDLDGVDGSEMEEVD